MTCRFCGNDGRVPTCPNCEEPNVQTPYTEPLLVRMPLLLLHFIPARLHHAVKEGYASVEDLAPHLRDALNALGGQATPKSEADALRALADRARFLERFSDDGAYMRIPGPSAGQAYEVAQDIRSAIDALTRLAQAESFGDPLWGASLAPDAARESMRFLAHRLRNMHAVSFSRDTCDDAADWLERLSESPAPARGVEDAS